MKNLEQEETEGTEILRQEPAKARLCVIEPILWHPISEEMPDADSTVLLHMPGEDDEVWLGYFDGEDWRAVDGGTVSGVIHWAELPKGPKS